MKNARAHAFTLLGTGYFLFKFCCAGFSGVIFPILAFICLLLTVIGVYNEEKADLGRRCCNRYRKDIDEYLNSEYDTILFEIEKDRAFRHNAEVARRIR